MTYELVKQLKEAGFYLQENKGTPYPPTLSELIEACGEGYFNLNSTKSGKGYDNHWAAYFGENPEAKGLGKTPEEAVAKLWLALNKKDGA